MSEFLKCVDENNPNNFVVLTDGDIRFYEDVNGEPTLTMPLTQTALYSITNGKTITTTEKFVTSYGTPQVFVAPSSVNIFNFDARELDQVLSIDTPTVSVGETGIATVGVSGRIIKPTSGNGVIVTPEFTHRIYYYSNISDLSSNISGGTYSGSAYMQAEATQFAIPVVNASSVVVYAILYGGALYTNSTLYNNPGTYGGSWRYYPWSYSMKVGIGGSSAPSAWGTTVSGTKSSAAGIIVVSASYSGNSGAYAHVYFECSGNSSGSYLETPYRNISSAGPFNNAMWPVMVRCLPDSGNLSLSAAAGDDVYTALVVGR